jgi:hypothetical protein
MVDVKTVRVYTIVDGTGRVKSEGAGNRGMEKGGVV